MENENISILLVEDDPNLGDILQEYLHFKGYKATLCKDGIEGYYTFQKNDYFDMCILDVMLPRMDGFALAEKIRAENKEIPIIFLTAKGLKEDKVQGFKVGGDDYVTKPFSMEELQCRINAIMRRCIQQAEKRRKEAAADSFQLGQYSFHTIHQTLSIGGEKTKLTTKESALLKLLCETQNEVLRREHALTQIWGEDSYFTGRSMDVFITKLRKYLKADPTVKIINVHGKGYKLVTVAAS